MAETTIDRLQIQIEATAKGTSAVFTQLESQLATVQKALDGLNIGKINAARAALNGGLSMNKAERDVKSSVDRIEQSLKGLEAIKNSALSGDSSALTSFQRKVTSIQSAIDTLGVKMQQAGRDNAFDNTKLDGYRESLFHLQEGLEAYKNEVANMPAPSSGDAESALDRLKGAAGTVGSAFAKLGSTIKTTFSNLVNAVKKAHNALSKLHDKISGFANKGFMRVLKYAFGIRSVYVLFRRLRKAITESFQELQNSGAFFQTTRANIEGLKASLTTLKFQFGAVFEPIFNAVAPALQTLINHLVSAMNALSAFTAKLMGKSTYSKAVANMGAVAKNTGSAAKAQKELNKQLQSFDELNNLTTHTSSGGGSGSGSSGSTPDAYYVEESVDNALGDFGKKHADLISTGDWVHVGRTISDKLSEVMESIPWDKIIEKARAFGTGLADFLNGLINGRLFSNIGSTIANAFNTLFEGLGAFAKQFDWVNLGLSIGAGITSFFKTSNMGQWGETVHDWIGGILDAGIAMLDNTDWAEIGNKLAAFLNGLDAADLGSKLFTFARKLAEGISIAITNLWNNSDAKNKIGLAIVGLIAAAKLTGLTLPGIGSAIASAISSVGTIAIPSLSISVGVATIAGIAGFEVTKSTGAAFAEGQGDKELANEYATYNPLKLKLASTIFANNGDSFADKLGEVSDAWSTAKKDSKAAGFFDTSAHALGNPLGYINDYNMAVFGAIDKLFGNKSNTNASPSGGGGGTGSTSSPSGGGGGGVNNALLSPGTGQLDLKVNTEMGGSLTKVSDFDKLASAWNNFVSKPHNMNNSIKSTMSGVFQKLPDITDAKNKFVDLANNWKDKGATLSSKVGGQISRITDLDTWKSKFSGLFNSWKDKANTFRSTVGGHLSKITDLDTWKSKATGLYNAWKGKSVTYKLLTSGANMIESLKSRISGLYNSWRGKTASFSLKFSAAASDLRAWVNNNVLSKVRSVFNSVPLLSGFANRLYLAKGGYFEKDTLAHIGEAGAEAVIPLEHNLQAIHKIANVMLDGMASANRYSYTASPSSVGFNGGISSSSNSNSDLIMQLISETQEQNRLLRQIASKDFSVSSRDVFNATRSESNNYYNRTGNSPFVF